MQRYPIKQYSKEQHADINLLVYIADLCNYKCSYCYNKFPRTKQLLDLDKLYQFLVSMQKNTQKKIAVELIGGEPTLHPNLLEFFEKASKLPDIQFAILTNFYKDLQYYLELIDKYKVRIIPTWHSLPNDKQNQQFVDKILSIPDKYFDYVADGKHYHNFFIRIMFEKHAFDEAKNLYMKLVNKIPAYIEPSLVADPSTKLDQYTEATKNISAIEYIYDDNVLKEYYRLSNLIKPYKQLYTVEYNDGTKELLSYNDMFMQDNFTFYMWKCNAGKDYLYIHCDGNVYKCQSYYESRINPLYNICKEPIYKSNVMKPTICACKTCSCDFEIMKQKIFKERHL